MILVKVSGSLGYEYVRCIIAIIRPPRVLNRGNDCFLIVPRRDSGVCQVQRGEYEVFQELGIVLTCCVLQSVGENCECVRRVDRSEKGCRDRMDLFHVFEKF